VDGQYARVTNNGSPFRSQVAHLEAAKRAADSKSAPILRQVAAPPSEVVRSPAAPGPSRVSS